MTDKLINLIRKSLLLGILAGTLSACAVYAPPPRRVAYYAPPRVVVVRPGYW